MLKEIIWVGAGSAIGGISRFAIGRWISNIASISFPVSTFSINIIGSFIIGMLLSLQSKHGLSSATMLFLATGFCGGFTTFSTFSLENILLIKQGQLGIAFLYMIASLIVGLAAVYLGFKVINH